MKTLIQISGEIVLWADKNFKYRPHQPELGLLEEVGEAAHVVLKAKQGIRGYDNPHKRKVDLIDAIADAGIYALHFAGIHALIPPGDVVNLQQPTEPKLFSLLAYAAGAVLSGDKQLAENNMPVLFDILNTMAANENVNLLDLINDTWDRVSKRDWTKNPETAHIEAEKQPSSSSSSSINPDDNSTIGG
jgi:NTP pyrophosphatase (non-canonical NTP hydrolase)